SLRPSYIHLQREPLDLPRPPTCFRPEAVILRSSCRTMPQSSWLEEARHRLNCTRPGIPPSSLPALRQPLARAPRERHSRRTASCCWPEAVPRQRNSTVFQRSKRTKTTISLTFAPSSAGPAGRPVTL